MFKSANHGDSNGDVVHIAATQIPSVWYKIPPASSSCALPYAILYDIGMGHWQASLNSTLV